MLLKVVEVVIEDAQKPIYQLIKLFTIFKHSLKVSVDSFRECMLVSWP
jgi:hypothetical protein